jgi:hypothetical protein
MMSKTLYNFKKSYGGTPEPQTPQDAPWLRGPSLKKMNETLFLDETLFPDEESS